MTSTKPTPTRPPTAVGIWLALVALAILIMVAIGGVTRLTGSGLSITDWRPVTGTIPPLSAADWESEFAKYMGSPQHRLVFPDMTVEEFKGIYWWEWIHRFWGRMIGLLFALPLAVFWVRGMIPAAWRMPLLGLLVLGGLQGALGWFMVASGLVDRPSVSPYRLSAHLGLAVLLFAAVGWLSLKILLPPSTVVTDGRVRPLRRPLCGFAWLLLLQIIYGGFVAGTKAAMAYPTFPRLHGNWFPSAASWIQPGWANFFENTAVIAFTHRWLGIGVFLSGVGLAAILGWRSVRLRLEAVALSALLVVQVLLGIGTTWMSIGHIPVSLGTLHQVNALLVLSVVLVLLRRTGSESRSVVSPPQVDP